MNNMKYIAELWQEGGCDYTIECGTKVVRLKATSLGEAEDELRKLIEEEYSYEETELSGARIYEITDEKKMDVTSINRMLYEQRREEQKRGWEAKEKADYERLKAKFEP